MSKKLSVVVPVYYNAQSLPELLTRLDALKNDLLKINLYLEVIAIDDGSKDNSIEVLNELEKKYNFLSSYQLTKNFGEATASKFGLRKVTGDAFCVLAADLQDPPELMVKMYTHWKNGIKLIVGNRADREESFFQKAFSNTYHKMIQKFALSNIPDGGFDYVFFDKQLKYEVVKINQHGKGKRW